MRKNVFYIALVFVLVGCAGKNTPSVDNASSDSIQYEPPNAVVLDTIAVQEIDTEENYSYKGISIFENQAYFDDKHFRTLFNIMEPLKALCYKNGIYSVSKCQIEKVNVFDNECSGDVMIEPTLNIRGNCLYIFKGLDKMTLGAVDTVSINFDELQIAPNTSLKFSFKGADYTLSASGNVREHVNEDGMKEKKMSDYKLYLQNGDVIQCMLEMKHFEITKILWIGDLDGDHRPDFIINSPAYELKSRMMLFLSSEAESRELVKLVSVTVHVLGC